MAVRWVVGLVVGRLLDGCWRIFVVVGGCWMVVGWDVGELLQ